MVLARVEIVAAVYLRGESNGGHSPYWHRPSRPRGGERKASKKPRQEVAVGASRGCNALSAEGRERIDGTELSRKLDLDATSSVQINRPLELDAVERSRRVSASALGLERNLRRLTTAHPSPFSATLRSSFHTMRASITLFVSCAASVATSSPFPSPQLLSKISVGCHHWGKDCPVPGFAGTDSSPSLVGEDSSRIVIGSYDGSIHILSSQNGSELAFLEGGGEDSPSYDPVTTSITVWGGLKGEASIMRGVYNIKYMVGFGRF